MMIDPGSETPEDWERAWEVLVENEAVLVAEIDRLRGLLHEIACSDSSAAGMLKARAVLRAEGAV